MHITQCARAFLLYFACLSFHAPFSILSILNAFGCAYGLGFTLSALDSCALTTSGHFPGEEKKKRNTQLYCPIHRHYNFSPVDFSQQNIIIIIMFFSGFWLPDCRICFFLCSVAFQISEYSLLMENIFSVIEGQIAVVLFR